MEYIKQFPVRTFKRGELLVQKGDSIHSLFAVRTGFIKVTSITNDGAERLIWLAGRYDIAPLEQLFSRRGETRFFYTALTDGSYYEVDKDAFLTFAAKDLQLMSEIARGMSANYDDFLARVDAMDSGSIKERLLRTLLYLAERLSADMSVNFSDYGLVLTHGELASMIGSTRETTSVTLNVLRTEKLIDYDPKRFVVYIDRVDEYLESSSKG